MKLSKLSKRMRRWTCVAGSFAMLAFASSLSAQGLTYVDADDFLNPNLTTSSGDPISSAIDQYNLSSDMNNDGLWRFRGADSGNMFGASGTVYESWVGEDTQELVQTLTGLNSGTEYDVYAVWWSATNDNWIVRGGLSSNPNANPVYDRTGAAGTAGNLGVFTNWSVPPADNFDISDGFPGVEGATLEGNRVMLVAKVGTGTASASGELPVFIDDAVDLPGAGRGWFDGVAYAPVGSQATVASATIDRTTGNLTLSATSDFTLDAINIRSNAGGLEPANWASISGNIDGSGDGSFDFDTWEITSSTANSLAENEIGPIDGAVVGPGGTSTLSFGNVWISSPFEDVAIDITLTDSGFTVPLTVEFTGGEALGLGDFDLDGDLDVDDYLVVLRGLNQDMGGLTDVESYALGDVNGDQQGNFQDLADFRDLYDAANGAGAFDSLVPEPNASMLMLLGFLGIFAKLRRRTKKFVLVCGLLSIGLLMPSVSEAQITYIDADEQAGGNTAGLPGGWVNRGAGGGESGEDRNFANEGGALQANGSVDEIATTISIPDAGVYQIYTFFWDDGANWNIQAGLESGMLTDYDRGAAGVFPINADTQVPGLPTVVNGLNVLGQGTDTYDDWIDGNRTLYAAPVGITSVDDGGSVTVYVDHDTNLSQRTWYDGIGWGDAQPTLTAEVNTTTGAITLRNDFEDPIDLSYYEINSPSGSLNRAGWNSLDDQNYDAVDGSDAGSVAGDSLLEGWDEAGLDTDTTVLNETFFLGQSTLGPGATLSLGNGYTAGGAEDLTFNWGLVAQGNLELGIVEYVTGGGPSGDFNNDGEWDCADINALTAAIAAGSGDLSFDMNGDGVVSPDDLTAAGSGWLAVGGSQNPAATGGNPFLPGDGNLDGVVDVSDFGIWNANKFTSIDAWCSGDFNADGVVDVSDFGAWNANKFTSSSDAAAVPEPATFSLALCCLLFGALGRRHL